MERSGTNYQSDKSVAELTKQLSDQATALASKEVELAKAELALKGRRLGLGAGMFGGAGLVVAYAFAALTACLILALATTLDAWLGADRRRRVRGDRSGAGSDRQEEGRARNASCSRAGNRKHQGRRSVDQSSYKGGQK
jgi:Putative Actinobacterial Holin-X, holin superfamily III